MSEGGNSWKKKAGRVRLVIMDVDGVLTDGKIFPGLKNNQEYKSFNIKDGSAIVRARQAGLLIAWVSGRKSQMVEKRAEELGVGEVHQGVSKKMPVFQQIMSRAGCTQEETAYIGDDYQDVQFFKGVGFKVAVADAHPEAVKAADYVTSRTGGEAAVMEVLDMLMELKS